MNRIGQRIAFTAFVLFMLFAASIGAISYFFGVEVTTEGEAQDFSIGETRNAAYDTAANLLREGKITAIHTWPIDEFHRPFQSNEDPKDNTDPRWVLVVKPHWWNNTITLKFENNVLAEIRRDRIYCELP